jgi:CrcB protein
MWVRSPPPALMTPLVPFAPTTVLWVALGGAIGSALRFAAGEWMRRLPAFATFPWGTLIINVLGSLLIGWFLRWSTTAETTPQLRAFVAIGICGGFTTFSTFAAENFALLQGGQVVRASLHALLSLVLTVGATFVGYSLARP